MNSLAPLRCLRAPLVKRQPISQPSVTLALQQTSAFSSTETRQKRNKGGPKKDARITQIRYFLQHPKTPRPLRFSRLRYLRHWTIHRAWQLYQSNLRKSRELELERQYNSMREACEALRLMDGNGMTVEDGLLEGDGAPGGKSGGKIAGTGKDVGRLYRIAMEKKGIWDSVPIEYARIQTDGPPKDGWNHEWSR